MRFPLHIAKSPLVLMGVLAANAAGAQITLDELPSVRDLRDIDGHSYIGPVRNQGSSGVCYAFSACAIAEAAYNLAHGLYDGNCIDFSESYIAWTLGDYYDGITDTGAYYQRDALQSFVDYGACLESDFPFTETRPANAADYLDCGSILYSGWHNLPEYDIGSMKMALYKFGGISAMVDASASFHAYSDGVYSDDEVADGDWFPYVIMTVNHEIALTGWNEDTHSWILRNSWDTTWGENGYMRIDYYAARVSAYSAYITYGDWEGEDFDLSVTAPVSMTGVDGAGAQAGDTTTSYGLYYWAGNDTNIDNESTIRSAAQSSVGYAFSHGLFLFAGDNASITNNGEISSSAKAGGNYLSTAYGICFQGETFLNNGSVSALAANLDSGRATAYGVWFSSFDEAATFENNGTITADCDGENAHATGVSAIRAASVVNNGNIQSRAYDLTAGLIADRCASVVNTAVISAENHTNACYGTLALYSTLTNQGAEATILAKSDSGAIGGVVLDYNSSLYNLNGGRILGVSNSSESVGAMLYGASDGCNLAATISASSSTGMSYGVSLHNASTFHNGEGGLCYAYSDNNQSAGADLMDASSFYNEGGTIQSHSDSYLALGILSTGASTAVNEDGTVVATSDYGNAIGIYAVDSSLYNTGGTIHAESDYGGACGAMLLGGSLYNGTDSLIDAESLYGYSIGLSATSSAIRNDGIIRGDTSELIGCKLSGTGVFDGAVTLNGCMVSPGDGGIGTLSVTGNLVTSGSFILNMEIDASASDVLAVGGYADLSASDNTLNVIRNGYLASGNYAFLTSEGAAGSFSVSGFTPIYSWDVSVASNGFTLNLTRHSYASFVDGKAFQSMGYALDAARPLADGWLGDALESIDSMESATEIGATLSGFYPAVNATATNVVLGALHDAGSFVTSHWSDWDGNREHCWMSVLDSDERRDALDGFSAYHVKGNGVIAGADHRFGTRWKFGFAASGQRQTLSYGGMSDANLKLGMAYLYAAWDKNPGGSGLYVNSAFGLGTARITTKRGIAWMDEIAEGRHQSRICTASLSAGYDLRHKVFELRPFVGMEYALLHENAYSERGSAAGLHFDSTSNDSCLGSAGISLSAVWGNGNLRLQPELRTTLQHEFSQSVYGSIAAFSDGTAFHAIGRDLAENSFRTDLILRAIIHDSTSVVLDYSNTDFDGDESSHSLSLSLRVAL